MADIDVTVEKAQPIAVDVSTSQPIQITVADNPINVELSTAQPIDVQVKDEQPIDVKIADIVQVFTGGTYDKYYEVSFLPTSSLSVNHSLNKYPAVTILDTAGDEVEGQVVHVDNNNILVNFSAAFGGVITCN